MPLPWQAPLPVAEGEGDAGADAAEAKKKAEEKKHTNNMHLAFKILCNRQGLKLIKMIHIGAAYTWQAHATQVETALAATTPEAVPAGHASHSVALATRE